jgi:ribosomal protein S18 acetylase RimI-like enzyme
MTNRERLKSAWFRLLGKDPEAVVVCFHTGNDDDARAMTEEVARLIPGRPLYIVDPRPGPWWKLWRSLRARFRRSRIGMSAVLFDGDPAHRDLRIAAFLLAPRKVLAYNAALERHHLRASQPIASLLFWLGVPLDRIWLRPWWLFPWKKDRSVVPDTFEVIEGRATSPDRRRVAVVSPYFPYPLSHGGAVRIFHLLREAAPRFDIYLFAFTEGGRPEILTPVLDFCARVILVPKPRYREPRWSSIDPPEVCEYRSPAMRRALDQARSGEGIELTQVEYTHLAGYGGDVLVAHDVTADLHRQVYERRPTLAAWWNWRRWLRFERRAFGRFGRVVAMADKDARLIEGPNVRVIANGVDLDRFRPQPESDGVRLLFIGSFRHFPNVLAYRFFVEGVWPRLRDRFPEMTLTAVAGPEALIHWRAATGLREPPAGDRVRLLEFVSDVQPLYVASNIVIVPTPVSAGTNVKVLEAMAMERAVVSTPSGCAGLGLVHGESVWIASGELDFAAGVAALASDPSLRARLAAKARRIAEENYSWSSLGAGQRALWRDLLNASTLVRPGTRDDLAAVASIQEGSGAAPAWRPESYLDYDLRVAERDGAVIGFIVSRGTAASEREILMLAVAPLHRRQGVATLLLADELGRAPLDLFFEVRESNEAARSLYEACGFVEVGRRAGYYENPPEAAIVMRMKKW